MNTPINPIDTYDLRRATDDAVLYALHMASPSTVIECPGEHNDLDIATGRLPVGVQGSATWFLVGLLLCHKGRASRQFVLDQARRIGHSERTMERAREALGIVRTVYGFGADRTSIWSIPIERGSYAEETGGSYGEETGGSYGR